MPPLGDFGPAPPGVDLSETQSANIVTSVSVIMALGVIAVLLRIFSRMREGFARIGADDICVIVALIFAIGTAILCLLSIPYGGGKHLWVVTFPEFTKLWQMTYAFVLIYAACVSLTKASILLFYRRIFGVGWGFWVCMSLVIGYWVAITIAWLAGCRPASYFWEQFTNPHAEGSCIDTSLFYFVNGICAMLIDICILVTPIPTIIKLQMPRGQKIAVSLILLLGAFVCIASIVRIIYMDRLVKATDFTWAMAEVFIWSCCEPFVGIVCACLPTYGPLFKRWWKTMNTKVAKSGGDHSSSNNFDPNSTKVRVNKAKREWNRLQSDDTKLRCDDEVELTHDISGGMGRSVTSTQTHSSDDHQERTGHNIVVKKDITWTSSPSAGSKKETSRRTGKRDR